MAHWTDAHTWKENWNEEAAIDPGAQAAAKRVTNKVSGQPAFMKILNSQSDDERRSRFFREASAYAALQHANIPRLIESNAHRHDDLSFKVYLVTELIVGPTLTAFIGRQRTTLEQAITLTLRLLDVAAHFHRHDWVHRDIKPDNIIMRGDDFADPVLVDFGVSYKDAITTGFETELAQELGNRFFRLPELGVNSPVKHDSRTDLTFIAGVMFFCLTCKAPYQPLDGEHKMPHQHTAELSLLREAAPSVIYSLLAFFDRAFDHRLTSRFATTEEMAAQLNALRDALKNGDAVSEPNDLESLRQRENSAASARFSQLKVVYTTGMGVISAVHARYWNRLPRAMRATCRTTSISRRACRPTSDFTISRASTIDSRRTSPSCL